MAPLCPWVKLPVWLLEIVRFWPRLIWVGSVAVLFDVLTSPPPAMVAVLITDAGASDSTSTVSVTGGITRCRGQRVGSSAGNGLQRDAARPARAAGRHWNETRRDTVDQGDGAGGRGRPDIAYGQGVIQGADGLSVPG